jgi:hypothetical protein
VTGRLPQCPVVALNQKWAQKQRLAWRCEVAEFYWLTCN